jgi:hypothetical protein
MVSAYYPARVLEKREKGLVMDYALKIIDRAIAEAISQAEFALNEVESNEPVIDKNEAMIELRIANSRKSLLEELKKDLMRAEIGARKKG